MKHILTGFFSFLFILSSIAQSEVLVQKRLFQNEPQYAFVTSLERSEIKDKDIDEMWEDYLDEFNSKPDFNKDLQMEVAEEVEIGDIASESITVYMRKTNVSGSQTEFVIWMQNKNGVFIGGESTSNVIPSARQWVLGFPISIKRKHITEQLEESQDDLEDLMDDKEDLTDDLEDARKEIEDLKQDIEKEEEKISEVEKKLPEVEADLKKKQIEVDKLKKELRDLEAIKSKS
jgi:hypothetical protein